MGHTTNLKGEKLDPDKTAIPCGLIARSYFNDKFDLYNVSSEGERIPNTAVKVTKMGLNETGISWETDRDKKSKKFQN